MDCLRLGLIPGHCVASVEFSPGHRGPALRTSRASWILFIISQGSRVAKGVLTQLSNWTLHCFQETHICLFTVVNGGRGRMPHDPHTLRRAPTSPGTPSLLLTLGLLFWKCGILRRGYLLGLSMMFIWHEKTLKKKKKEKKIYSSFKISWKLIFLWGGKSWVMSHLPPHSPLLLWARGQITLSSSKWLYFLILTAR